MKHRDLDKRLALYEYALFLALIAIIVLGFLLGMLYVKHTQDVVFLKELILD